jgi:hypothetical protein
MPQLKASFIAAVHEALEKSRFSAADFQVSFPESGSTLVAIIFRYKQSYFLHLNEETDRRQVTVELPYSHSKRIETVKKTVISVTASPGKYKANVSSEIDDIGNFIAEIPMWCENIRADLYALTPKADPLEVLREQLRENLEKLIDAPDEYFNAAELEVVDVRFDRLYEEFSKLKEEHTITKQALDDLSMEFAEFKSSARAYPKGLWAKITSNKLVKATGSIINSPEGRTFLFQEIRKALGLSSDA